MLSNTESRYGLVAKLLHWTIALFIIGLIWLGWYMVDLTYFDRWANESLRWHKALGLIVLVPASGKILWMICNPAPALPESIARWQQAAARMVHYSLVAMMLLLPISGYVISTSAGQAVEMFGWFKVPALFEIDTGLRDLAISTHYYLAYGCAVLAAAHGLAAIKHQFIDKDETLAKMLWR